MIVFEFDRLVPTSPLAAKNASFVGNGGRRVKFVPRAHGFL